MKNPGPHALFATIGRLGYSMGRITTEALLLGLTNKAV